MRPPTWPLALAAARSRAASRYAAPLSAFVALFAATSCVAPEQPRHVSAEHVTDVPPDVVFYPHVLYGADAAYLVDGKWYRPATDGWVTFAEEPLELELVRRALEPRRASFLGI